MPLEELREFLQENISSSFQLGDDVVIEQLQAAMSELRKMKLDLPPARMHRSTSLSFKNEVLSLNRFSCTWIVKGSFLEYNFRQLLLCCLKMFPLPFKKLHDFYQ